VTEGAASLEVALKSCAMPTAIT